MGWAGEGAGEAGEARGEEGREGLDWGVRGGAAERGPAWKCTSPPLARAPHCRTLLQHRRVGGGGEG